MQSIGDELEQLQQLILKLSQQPGSAESDNLPVDPAAFRTDESCLKKSSCVLLQGRWHTRKNFRSPSTLPQTMFALVF